MSERSGRFAPLFFLTCMEYAWIAPLGRLVFALFPGMASPDPIAPALAIAFSASATALLRGRGLARYILVAMESLVLGALGFAIMGTRYGIPPGFPAKPAFMDSLEIAMIAGWAALLWYRGVNLGRRPVSVRSTGDRFDAGAGMLLATALLDWGIGRSNTGLEYHVAGFFLSGMAALSSVGRADRANRESGGAGSGRSARTILSGGFALAVFSAFSGIWLFARPVLGRVARFGLDVSEAGFSAILPWIVAFLRALFGFRRAAAVAGGEAKTNAGAMDRVFEKGAENPLVRFILLWSIRLAIAGLALAIVAWIAAPLLRWLFSPSSGGARPLSLAAFLRSILDRLSRFFLRAKSISGWPGRHPAWMDGVAGRAYARMCRWGRRSRSGPAADETPIEYGKRLARCFPGIAEVAEEIALAFSREYYGGETRGMSPIGSGSLSEKHAAKHATKLGAKHAAKLAAKLASPRLWPVRLRHWFGASGNQTMRR